MEKRFDSRKVRPFQKCRQNHEFSQKGRLSYLGLDLFDFIRPFLNPTQSQTIQRKFHSKPILKFDPIID